MCSKPWVAIVRGWHSLSLGASDEFNQLKGLWGTRQGGKASGPRTAEFPSTAASPLKILQGPSMYCGQAMSDMLNAVKQHQAAHKHSRPACLPSDLDQAPLDTKQELGAPRLERKPLRLQAVSNLSLLQHGPLLQKGGRTSQESTRDTRRGIYSRCRSRLATKIQANRREVPFVGVPKLCPPHGMSLRVQAGPWKRHQA